MSPFERAGSPHGATAGSIASPPAFGPRRHRPDLDGLRGYAVIIAVLFHFGLATPGGFIGLDLFFVLSGYLIGGILFSDTSGKGLSFARFYEYRVRRIAPAALVVILVSLVFAQLILLPSAYEYFAKSALANLYFGTNHLFLGEDGYFDPASENKPLLHTWSLAVEEQFYFVFPLIVLGLYRWWGRKAWLPTIIALAVVSFGFNLVLGGRDPDADYFLAPARAWELLIGAIVALLPAAALAVRWRGPLAFAGLVMILASTVLFDRDMVYPGYAGLLPCLGAASLIYAGAVDMPAVNRWVGNRFLRFFGVISYSFYLWHWPALVFARYLLVEPPTLAQRIAILGAVFLVSVLSWKYVEQPFRAGRGLSGRQVVGRAAAAALVVLGCGIAVLAMHGLPGRTQFDPAVIAVENEKFRTGDCFANGSSLKHGLYLDHCSFGTAAVTPDVLLWGDSHARQWQAALIDEAQQHGRAFVQASTSTCPPAIGFDLARRPGCKPNNDRVIAWLDQHPEIRIVVLAGRWGSYDTESALPAALAATAATLRSHGIRVFAVDSVPTYTRPVPILLTAWLWRHGDQADVRLGRDTPDSYYSKDRRAFRTLFAGVSLDGVLDVEPRLCNAQGCAIRKDGQPLYIDETHLSRYAARKFAGIFEPVFAERVSR